MPKRDREKSTRTHPYTENYRPLRNAKTGESVPQGNVHQLVIKYQMASPETYIQATLYRLSRLYLEMCMYIYIFTCNNL